MKAIASLILLSCTLTATLSAAELPDFSQLIEKNAPAVVQIEGHTSQTGRTVVPQQMAPEEFFRYFFDGQGQLPRIPRGRGGSSHGSGFFIDSDGYILTNAHVVKGNDEITVSTTEQKEFRAEVVGVDERTDVALLKIKKDNNPTVTIGNSDKLKVGNWVLAIGSPFGFDYTATAGIVSAVSRSLPDGTYVPFIQTDAAVNPGNSGGPLFNLEGEVIGINSQIYSNTGSFNGLAFAIPINTAMRIANQLKSKGFVSRGWLGVGIQIVNHKLAKSFGLDKPKGALVASVSPDSPAEKGGLRVGDIILKFDNKVVNKSTDLPPLVGSVAAGKTVHVDILRNGKKSSLSVTIGELDEGQPKTSLPASATDNKGLAVTNLSAIQKNQLGIDNGVAIVAVTPDSAAAEAGFRRGDIIININNQRIDSVKTFKQMMQQQTNQPMAVLIIRDGRSLFIPLSP